MRFSILGLLLAASVFAGSVQPSAGQEVATRRDQVNDGVVGLVAARRTGTMTIFADDMAAVLNEVKGLRVLPILGRGSQGNIEDLLYLRGVDVAITQGDVLDFYREFDLESNIDGKIGYIASLGLEEAHLLAREEIQTVDDLAGKQVNFGWAGSGSYLSASILFDNLGINVDVTEHVHKNAMVMLKAGEIDAMFWMGGSPIDSLQELNGDEGLHLLSIPPDRITASTYSPSVLSSQHYPNLLPPGGDLPTVQVNTVMAAYNWPSDHPKHEAVQLFADSLYENLRTLQSGEAYHPKWGEMNLGAEVSGWRRLFAR